MSKSRVSIVMTVFNGEKYLNESLQSLLRQDLENWELIVIENGSTDSTAELLKSYSDPRIRVIYLRDNIGRTPALNLAIMSVSTEYIAILDADDLSHPLRLKRQVDFLDLNPVVGLVGTWSEFIDEFGTIISRKSSPLQQSKIIETMMVRNPMVHSSIMYRRSLYHAVGGYNERYVYAQDFDLLIKFAKNSELAVIPEYLCAWRKTNSGMSADHSMRITRSIEDVTLFSTVTGISKVGYYVQSKNIWKQIVCHLILCVYFLADKKFLRGIEVLKPKYASKQAKVFKGYEVSHPNEVD